MDSFPAARRSNLLVDAVQVELHSGNRQVEAIGDLLIAIPIKETLNDTDLRRGE